MARFPMVVLLATTAVVLLPACAPVRRVTTFPQPCAASDSLALRAASDTAAARVLPLAQQDCASIRERARRGESVTLGILVAIVVASLTSR